MRFPPRLIAPAAFLGALLISILAASWAASWIEKRTGEDVRGLYLREGLDWVEVQTDGLQVRLHGTAPDEAKRFRAVNLASSLVDSGRIRDLMQVTPAQAIEAPRFSVELLRNDDGISIIGLVPGQEQADALNDEVTAAAKGAPVANMLEQADFPAPQGWDAAVGFGVRALGLLERAKISISADKVAITAISGSDSERRSLESQLARAKPEGLQIAMDISAPRPVLTPFTLRFLIDAQGARFDACSADTEQARDRIIAAAVASGLTGKADCVIGLGVPSPSWADATTLGIKAVAAMGGGSITFSDADVSLLATEATPKDTFDRVVGELQAALPDVFSLKATLPEKPKTAAPEGPPEFTATLSAEGAVQLRGRLTDEMSRNAVSSFAKARFGASNVYTATRLDPNLPEGWPVRVLAGLQAMSNLAEGSIVVRADAVEVTGITISPGAQAEITRTLSGQLGQGQAFTVNVQYDKSRDPEADLPTPQECVAQLNAVLAKHKIVFSPGSAEIESDARDTMAALADILRKCPDVAMEIGGHTDAQGSETGNQALSQARAEAVLLGLQGRRVLVGSLTAKGYGESQPIADNGTEEGREKNRRIEFKLLSNGTVAGAAPVGPSPDAPATMERGAATDAGPNAAQADGTGDTAGDTTGVGTDQPIAGEPMDGPDAPDGTAPDNPADDGTAQPDATAPATDQIAGGATVDAPQGDAASAGSDATAAPEEPYDSAAPEKIDVKPKKRPKSN